MDETLSSKKYCIILGLPSSLTLHRPASSGFWASYLTVTIYFLPHFGVPSHLKNVKLAMTDYLHMIELP